MERTFEDSNGYTNHYQKNDPNNCQNLMNQTDNNCVQNIEHNTDNKIELEDDFDDQQVAETIKEL